MRKKRTAPWVRRRRRVYIGCVLIALIISPLVLWRLGLRNEVRRELELLREAGIPTTRETYEAWIQQYPPLEVLEDYQVASTAYVALPFDVSPNFPSFRVRHDSEELFTVPYDALTLAAMRQAVELNAETLRLLRETRVLASANHTAVGRREEIVELCCAAACVAAHDGDGLAAANAILDGLVFTRTINATPWSKSLWRMRDEVGQLMRGLASAAGRVTLPDTALMEIQSVLEAPDWENEYRESSVQRVASMVVEFPSLQLDAPQVQIANMIFGFFDRYMSDTMRLERKRLALIGKSIEEQQVAFDEMKEHFERRNFSFGGPPMHLRVAIAGIEAIRYTQKNGAIPASLDVLAREGLDLNDFYSGAPLGYNVDGKTFVLYSVAKDLKDDGGSARDDTVFRATLPGAR